MADDNLVDKIGTSPENPNQKILTAFEMANSVASEELSTLRKVLKELTIGILHPKTEVVPINQEKDL